MKKLALCGLFLAAWAHAQVSYEALKAHVHSGTAPDEIRQTIMAEGLSFEVDIHLLRQMKSDRLPDWLIDFLIEYNPAEWVSRGDAPRRYDGERAIYDDDEPRFYRWSRASYWGYSPWWSCVDWYLYRYNPWAYCFDGAWGYAGLGLWWPYYRGVHHIYNYGYGHNRYGYVTSRGYRVSDRRVVGRAYPRGTSVSRAGTVPQRTRSTATRTSSRYSPRSVRARTNTGTQSARTATRSSNSGSRSSATRSSSRSSSRYNSSSSSRSRSSASRSTSSRSRSSASRSSSSRSRSSANRSSSSRSRSSASRSSSSGSRSSASRSSSSSSSSRSRSSSRSNRRK